MSLVCVSRGCSIQTMLVGCNENTLHMKMHRYPRPNAHLKSQHNSVETTQHRDDHNKPEHWSQHEASISQASIRCEANPGFVVNTGGWLMSNQRTVLRDSSV